MRRDRIPTELDSVRFDRPGLDFIVLHGSGAAGNRHALSDWDFVWSGSPGFDVEGLRRDLSLALGSDDVDLADLAAAGGLLRHRVADRGLLLFERHPGLFQAFMRDAILFWCDIEPIVSRAHNGVLDRLKG